MLAPKNSRFIWTITDACLLLLFAAAGAGGTAYLAVIHWAHLGRCHRRHGSACEASIAGGALGCVVVVVVSTPSVPLLLRARPFCIFGACRRAAPGPVSPASQPYVEKFAETVPWLSLPRMIKPT